MDIPVLIETTADGRYRARSGEPLVLTAEGDSRDAALINLNRALHVRLTAGAELTQLRFEKPEENPWPSPAHTNLGDNPLFDEVQQHIAEYRRQLDAAEADAV